MPSTEHVYRPAPHVRHADRGDATPASFDRLVTPTWAEVDQAREQYVRQAKRFRFWRVWFIGMFTIYTTFVGILLLRVLMGL